MFFGSKKTYLGIDIGGSTLKLVELEKKGKKIVLRNYASTYSQIKSDPLLEERESFLKMPPSELGKIIDQIIKKANFKSRKAAVSVPIHSTFTTSFNLPIDLKGEDLDSAIRFEAKKHVPLPINEVVLEWRVTDEKEIITSDGKREVIGGGEKKRAKKRGVFLIAIPQDIVQRYQLMAESLSIDLEVLEVEIFSLFRTTITEPNKQYLFIDIGGQNTNVTLFSGGLIKDTFNINISGDDFTRAIIHYQKRLTFSQAEKIKKEKGLTDPETKKALVPYLDDILERIKYRLPTDISIDKLVLVGGAVLLKGFREYFQEKLKIETVIIDPWAKVATPSVLKEKLAQQGPSFAVAVGLALRGFEE